MSKISKRRKKELRNIYEYIKGNEFVKEIEKQPSVSWGEWVDIMRIKH